MNQPLLPHETRLVGVWIEKDGAVIADETCSRIDWLIDNSLDLVIVNGEEWTAIYRNPDDQRYWECSYPDSHVHGGGPPLLRRLDPEEVLGAIGEPNEVTGSST